MQDKAWTREVLSLIEKKYRAVAERNHDRIPYTCIDGRFDDWSGPDRICWWTNGFWAGLLWLLYSRTKEETFRENALRIEEKLDRNLMTYMGMDHDSGFKWLLTSGASWKLTGSALSEREIYRERWRHS